MREKNAYEVLLKNEATPTYILLKIRLEFKGTEIKKYINEYKKGFLWLICSKKTGNAFYYDDKKNKLISSSLRLLDINNRIRSSTLIFNDDDLNETNNLLFNSIEHAKKIIEKVENKGDAELLYFCMPDLENDLDLAITNNDLNLVNNFIKRNPYNNSNYSFNYNVSISICDAIKYSTKEITETLMKSDYYRKSFNLYQTLSCACAFYDYDLINYYFEKEVDFTVNESHPTITAFKNKNKKLLMNLIQDKRVMKALKKDDNEIYLNLMIHNKINDF
jgi:hypothetical protein